MTAPVREPRSTAAATELLERYATLQGQIDTIEADRQAAIAAVNARADTAVTALIEQRDAIAEKLEPWWVKAGKKLLPKDRKTVELGGCLIGTRSGRSSLAFAGDERALAKVLQTRKWAAGLFTVSVSLDKTAIRKALTGVHGKKLKALGFSDKDGDELFVLQRAEQEGTMA